MPLWTAEVKAFGVVVRIEQVSTALPLRSFQQSHTPADWDRIAREIKSARWLVWHRKGRKAIPRMKAINEELEKWPNQERSALWWSVCRPTRTWSPTLGYWSTMGRVIGRVCPLPAALRNLRSTKWSACAWPRNSKCDGPTRERTSWPW